MPLFVVKDVGFGELCEDECHCTLTQLKAIEIYELPASDKTVTGHPDVLCLPPGMSLRDVDTPVHQTERWHPAKGSDLISELIAFGEIRAWEGRDKMVKAREINSATM